MLECYAKDAKDPEKYMKITAIVYTSNTGFTERYAKMLSEKTGLPVYTLKEAKRKLEKGSEIIYFGWLMASLVRGYRQAVKRFRVSALCGVCMGDSGSQIDAVRKSNAVPEKIPVFTLQGGMDHSKLKGIYRSMINMLIKGLSSKNNKSADEEKMLELIKKGGDYVSEENLDNVIKWIEG